MQHHFMTFRGPCPPTRAAVSASSTPNLMYFGRNSHRKARYATTAYSHHPTSLLYCRTLEDADDLEDIIETYQKQIDEFGEWWALQVAVNVNVKGHE